MTLRDAKCGLSDGHSDRPSLALAARMQPPPLALASNNMARSTPRNWARGHRGRSRSAMPMFDVILMTPLMESPADLLIEVPHP